MSHLPGERSSTADAAALDGDALPYVAGESFARLAFLYNHARMKFLQSIRVAIVLLALPLLLLAEPVSQLRPTDYVNDFAHVLDPTTIAQLDNICQQLDQKAHAQIAVVTMNSLDGSDIESYAVALYKQWGIGSKATDHGVLILLAVQDRKYRIEVGYGLEPILPDGKVGGFGREAVPLLKQNDYNGAVLLMTSRVADVIAQDAGIELTGPAPQLPAQPQAEPGTQLVRETAAHSWRHSADRAPDSSAQGPVLDASVRRRWRRRLRGGGYSGGGGFGGGGGGFGGFGGGSSGGGGASGSW